MLLAMLLACALLRTPLASSHEVRPAYLEITERPAGGFEILWKQPTLGEMGVRLVPHLSSGWLDASPAEIDSTPSFTIKIWRPTDRAALDGQTLAIEGLEQTITDVLVSIKLTNGTQRQEILKPNRASLVLDLHERSALPVPAYLRLGVEHILTGGDHLLFVLGLLLLVRGRWRLLSTITAFTVAHSITLALASLGWVQVEPAIIEALIALSIVFVAVEIVRLYRGTEGFTAHYPWVVAFAFGLLHGLAFAGALANIGLPRDAVPLSLFLFNVGVEIGQLLFVGIAMSAYLILRRLPRPLPRWTRWIAPYVIGSFAAFWLFSRAAVAEERPAPNPQRNVYFGDLHLHTTYSFDAYINNGTRTTPDDGYKFASGQAIRYLDHTVQRQWPLDFLAVTDHSENIGVMNRLDDPNSSISKSDLGQRLHKAQETKDQSVFWEIVRYFTSGAPLPGVDESEASKTAWAKEVQAANDNYRPGRFTTFIGYEWTSMPEALYNLHRNVIFSGNQAPAPFTALDSRRPEDLWTYIEGNRAKGIEALAIPHNADASGGFMYDWNDSDGKPIDEAYAQRRALNEPLSEISQNKGQSETVPELSPNDEFASFEVFTHLLVSKAKSAAPGSYVRDAYGRGLVIRERTGVNPYKFGAVGGTDFHNGLSTSNEDAFDGRVGLDPRTDLPKGAAAATAIGRKAPTPGVSPDEEHGYDRVDNGSGNLTAVWAEENTRESIFAALKRKETYATSGTRLKLRFFGGWAYGSKLTSQADFVKAAYRNGVPMGGDLPAKPAGAKAPRFAVWALKDPDAANLDRLQIVKVWLRGGKQAEKVFDVALSDKRRVDPKTGKAPAVGNTVDLKTAKYTNSIGATELSAVWQDPEFDPQAPAVYYLRAIEIPTPRWSTILSVKSGAPLPADVPTTIQERGWSSPIWFTP